MKVAYYPGCTLKLKAKNLEQPGLAAMAALGVELVEIDRWNCCGVVAPLADDDLLRLVAPTRNLVRAKEQGFDKIVTMCSMCNNALARANLIMRDDEERRDTINRFMEEEIDYAGEVEVRHLLSFLRDEIGWETIKSKVTRPLKGARVAPYYGCTLVRPRDVGIDSPERPTLMSELIECLGGKAVAHPAQTECCGSYQSISHPEAALPIAEHILLSAESRGAAALISSCPLCEHNLSWAQSTVRASTDKTRTPTFYFTQLLAIALGVDEAGIRLDLNHSAATELLRSTEILLGEAQ